MSQQDRYLVNSVMIFVGFLSISVVVAAAKIPLGSKLSLEKNEYWVSANEDFALGFLNHTDQRNNQYIVGIRFNSKSIPVSKQTIVWVAGADVSVGSNSYFELTQSGNLILFDSSKRFAVWTTNTSRLSVASALLLNNGNLVLLDYDENVVWKSFLTPSDTLLPSQNLSVSQTLRAASKNSVSSYYSLTIVSGQMRLNWETNVNYWRTSNQSPPKSATLGVVFGSDGSLNLLDKKLRPVWSAFGKDHNDSSVNFRFIRLDVDGNLRMYSWDETSESWRSVWQAVENQCTVFATCGNSGICVFTASGSTMCKCPFSSTSRDPNSKCLALYQHKCDTSTTMVTLEHTVLYGIYPPNEDMITQTSALECKKSCLGDPLCTTVTFMNDGTGQCRAKRSQYVSGYAHPSLRPVSFFKACLNLDPVAINPRNLSTTFPSSSSPPSRPRKMFSVPCLLGAVFATVFAFVVLQIFIGVILCKRKISITKNNASTSIHNGLITLSYSEIRDITANFKHGLSPNAFKGVLVNKKSVVVQILEGVIDEKRFRGVASVVGSIRHKHLVKLEGYCCESQHRFLVYEYFTNGTVDKWFTDVKLKKRLTWRKRMEICVGVAKALAYLHTQCREFVNHGNLKWENVVLNDKLEPKVTGFGLGNIYNGCCENSRLVEQDVASFGKMLIIMVTGTQGGEDMCPWAYEEWATGHGEGVTDLRMEGEVERGEVERLLRIAFWCLQDNERLRPEMCEVMKVLDGTLTVDPPPPPYHGSGQAEKELLECDNKH